MLKNKFLVIAAFCFVGFSFASDSDQGESPSLTNKVKTYLKSAAESPVAASVFTFAAASLINHCLDTSSTYIPRVNEMGGIVQALIRDDNARLRRISFAIPTYEMVSRFGSMGLAYYASGKFFKDSAVNTNARLLGGLSYVVLNAVNLKVKKVSTEIESL